MSIAHKHNLMRFALSVSLWFAAWSCLIVALTSEGEPWPWGGLSVYLAVVAMTATLWWVVEIVVYRALEQVRCEIAKLQRDRETYPTMLADAVVSALSVERFNGR